MLSAWAILTAAGVLTPQLPPYPPYAVPRLSGVTIAGLPAVTGRIVVDQFGYLPNAAKFAVVSDPEKGYNAGDHYTPGASLEVRRRSDGHAVLTGAVTQWNHGAVHEDSGDRGWWFDFSALRAPGEYYVYDPSTQLRSTVFRVGPMVYEPVLKAATRMYYYQRLGTPLTKEYTKGSWSDDAAYLQDKRARYVNAKDDSAQERDLSGGWMDAGDTDKYPPFNGEVIHPLLFAYTANPSAFTDDFGIPESGNGLPDLLDEVKWQLDWLERMQFEDGSVSVKMGQIDYGGKFPLSTDLRPRYYGPKDSGATLYAAGIFAHAARVYSKFDHWKSFANGLEARAIKAWEWYKAHPRTFNTDTGEIKSGIANRSAEEQDRMEAYAAIHLLALTGDDKFEQALLSKVGTSRQLTEGIWSPYEAGASEALVDYLSLPKADSALVKRIRDQLVKSADSDHFAPAPQADLYRSWMEPTNYHWGSNIVRAGWGVVALLAAGQTDPATSARLKTRALDMLHSFHGVNPLSAVYLTNMGGYGAESSMGHMYHERYGDLTPFRDNPPPGYLVGGPNQSFSGKAAESSPSVDWVKKQPRGKAYMDTGKGWPESSWEITEPAIYYQAIYVRLLAAFARSK